MTSAPASLGPIRDRSPSPEEETGILDLLAIMVSNWRWIAAASLGMAVTVAAWSLTLKPEYTAATTFMPEQSSQTAIPAGLASLAGQFGGILGGSGGQSPRVYAAILRSGTITDSVLLSKFPLPGAAGAQSASLLDILKIEGATVPERLALGRRALSGQVDISVDNPTGVVRVDVTAADKELAANMANRFVAVLNEFNTTARLSSARDRSQFTQERLAEAEQALRVAEGQLRNFYETNRSWQLSPQLVFEEGRIRRQVDLRQEVYVTLAREYERTRIEQVNDAPVITVIDRAVPPLARSAPARRRLVTLAGLLGAGLGVVAVFMSHYVESARHVRGDDFLRFKGVHSFLRRPIAKT